MSRPTTLLPDGPPATPAHVDPAATLAELDLFAALPRADVEALASVVDVLHAEPGRLLFAQGDEADALHVIADGQVSISMRLPGASEVELTRHGRGEAIGEIALLEGGVRTASARARVATVLLALPRHEFLGLIASRHPSALGLRRSVLALVCARLRQGHAALARSMSGPMPRLERERGVIGPAPAPPTMQSLARLPFFSRFPPGELGSLRSAGRLIAAPAGTLLFAEGEHPEYCYVTINGAVEQVIERGPTRIRVRLAGPGCAFGYAGSLDGAAETVTARARERVILFALPEAEAAARIRGTGQPTRLFLDTIQRDLLQTLRQTNRFRMRLAVSDRQLEIVDRPE